MLTITLTLTLVTAVVLMFLLIDADRCLAYLVSVVYMSLRELDGYPVWRYSSLGLGIFSMSIAMCVAVSTIKIPTPKSLQEWQAQQANSQCL